MNYIAPYQVEKMAKENLLTPDHIDCSKVKHLDKSSAVIYPIKMRKKNV